jgi:hypothetical protein
MFSQIGGRRLVAFQQLQLSRGELFAGLFILGCANGLTGRMLQSINKLGLLDAILATFDISVIVFAAFFVGAKLVLQDKSGQIYLADVAIGGVCLLFIVLPIAAMSWLALTGLALYVLLFTDSGGSRRRGVVIFLALTVPMLWSRLLFDLFANFILAMDSSLVAWMLGTNRSGNMVGFADHSGNLVIFPSCSSLANMSLAFLCWVTVSQFVSHRWRLQDIFWCVLACASVVGVNIIRLSLMGLSPTYYEAIHSFFGESFVNIVVLSLIITISLLGVRHEKFSHA